MQIARNFFQYFAADCVISMKLSEPVSTEGNIISVLLGQFSLPNWQPFAIELDHVKGILIRDSLGGERLYPFEEGLGAIYLRPLPNERLEMVVWGLDEAGLNRAARLVPMLTGVGQPDFVVLGKESAWKGIAGARAIGFFDYAWNVSAASYLS